MPIITLRSVNQLPIRAKDNIAVELKNVYKAKTIYERVDALITVQNKCVSLIASTNDSELRSVYSQLQQQANELLKYIFDVNDDSELLEKIAERVEAVDKNPNSKFLP